MRICVEIIAQFYDAPRKITGKEFRYLLELFSVNKLSPLPRHTHAAGAETSKSGKRSYVSDAPLAPEAGVLRRKEMLAMQISPRRSTCFSGTAQLSCINALQLRIEVTVGILDRQIVNPVGRFVENDLMDLGPGQ